jgi:hypothetical protein
MSIDSSTIGISGYQADARETSPKTSLLGNEKRTVIILEKPDNSCRKIIRMGFLISWIGFFIGLGIGYSQHNKNSYYAGCAIGDGLGWIIGLAIGYYKEKK